MCFNDLFHLKIQFNSSSLVCKEPFTNRNLVFRSPTAFNHQTFILKWLDEHEIKIYANIFNAFGICFLLHQPDSVLHVVLCGKKILKSSFLFMKEYS